MAENIYDEIEIEDMTYDPALEIYHYPCPCGDRFEIAIADLRDNENIAVCPSCSLMIRVIYEVVRSTSKHRPVRRASKQDLVADSGLVYRMTCRSRTMRSWKPKRRPRCQSPAEMTVADL